MIQYAMHKDFTSSLQKMGQQGGESKRIADKVWVIWAKAQALDIDPFHGVPLTNNGESRIKHSKKYELGNGYRLITIHDQKCCMFCYVGNHQNCDTWLTRYTGLTIVKNNQMQFEGVIKSIDIASPSLRATASSDFADIKLYNRLESSDQSNFFKLIPHQIMAEMLPLSTMSTDNQLYDFASKIDDFKLSATVYDVLIALRAGDKNQALARMDLHFGLSQPIDELSNEEILEINDGMTIKKLVIGSKQYQDWFRQFVNSSGYQDWMLFMHPEQQKIVDSDFDGSAKLSGVSGSGKTCIVVNKAVRLAKSNNKNKILVLTLNKSLAALISELVNFACPDNDIRKNIVVLSFFELCQNYLYYFEEFNKNLFDDVTWKNNEHIDEVWREYYRCELNSLVAEVLMPIHKSLNSQGINPEDYLHQEFDWIRSAFSEKERNNYLKAERKGRAIPLQIHHRKLILQGLEGWERKMEFVGVIDYLGLSTRLSRHIENIQPKYSSILVDEVQDFGTIELKIIRKLVKEGVNDIFLCGDMAQSVLPKNQSFKDADINIPGARSLTIKRNYRNSREILRAAYEIFVSTMHGDVLLDGDIDILDPEFANFSTAKPLALKANSLEEEISYSLECLSELSKNNIEHKGCLAIAGYSLFEIKRFADTYNIQILDGSRGLQTGSIFLSDLEQTKGYEFDTICIVNCNKEILPQIDMPSEEQFRDACKLYVSMTRAKKELIISYSGHISDWVNNDRCKKYFDFSDWDSYVDAKTVTLYEPLYKMPQTVSDPCKSPLDMTGQKFLYTKHTIGMPLDLQDKIQELIDGIGLSREGKRIKWTTVRAALEDVKKFPHAKQLFGAQKTWKEFVTIADSISP
jgi:hypothetical protein